MMAFAGSAPIVHPLPWRVLTACVCSPRRGRQVVHPLLEQLRRLDLTISARTAALAEAERQAADDPEKLTHTQRLLLMAKDVQKHFGASVAGVSDSIVFNGHTDLRIGSAENL